MLTSQTLVVVGTVNANVALDMLTKVFTNFSVKYRQNMAKQNSNLQILDTVKNPSRQVEPGIDPRKKRSRYGPEEKPDLYPI